MRNLKRLKQRFGEKGLSNIVTTLLLIAVGIAGVGIVGGLMSSMAPAGAVTEVYVSSTDMIVHNATTASVAVTVKNVGTANISGSCTVSLYVGTTPAWTTMATVTTGVPIGATVSFAASPFASTGLAKGVIVNGRFANADSSFVKYFTILTS